MSCVVGCRHGSDLAWLWLWHRPAAIALTWFLAWELPFAITKTWKQRKCPSTEEWIKKMWYIYTTEYYSAIKRNEISASAATWMNLEIIMLRELSQTVRHQHQMLSLTCGIWKKTDGTSLQSRCWLTDIEKLMVSGGDSLEGGGCDLGCGMEILWNQIVMIIIQLQMW